MERGPLALFGAIVAVGLGPAMWLGAQFGHVSGIPQAPPAVTVQQNEQRVQEPVSKGGVGAAAPENPTEVLQTRPRSNIEPLGAPRTHRSSAQPSDTPSGSPDVTPSTSASPSAGDDEPSSEPTESTTTDPSDEPSTHTGGSQDPDDPAPTPPTGSADESSSEVPLNEVPAGV